MNRKLAELAEKNSIYKAAVLALFGEQFAKEAKKGKNS